MEAASKKALTILRWQKEFNEDRESDEIESENELNIHDDDQNNCNLSRMCPTSLSFNKRLYMSTYSD